MASIDRDSVEIRSFQISAKDPVTGLAVDITADSVSVAFTDYHVPSDRPTTWVACARSGENNQYVDVQFGPSGFQLAPGPYRRWVKFADGAQAPVFLAPDRLTVT